MDKHAHVTAVYGPAKYPCAGFTILELLIVLVIVSIVYSSGIPAAWSWILDTRQRTSSNLLFTHLQMARNTAITHQSNVVVCQSNDGNRCSGRSSWQYGWIVFTDPNDNEQFDISETLLSVQQPLGNQVNIHFSSRNGGRYVRYTALGSGWPNGTFTLCDRRGSSSARAIVLSLTGRPRMDGVTASGKPLNCDNTADSH